MICLVQAQIQQGSSMHAHAAVCTLLRSYHPVKNRLHTCHMRMNGSTKKS